MEKCRYNEVIKYLESWDIEPTAEKCIEILNGWIKNLYSHIGKEAHEHSLACGIMDDTGISWEEQDEYTLNQIREYLEEITDCINGLQLLTTNIWWMFT